METEKKSSGALLGLVIIIIILVAGGVYAWQNHQKTAETQTKQAQDLSAQNSDDLDSLKADVESTDPNVNVDVDTIE